LVAGSLAEVIPMPVIGGLILVIGAELVSGRWPDIMLVLRTAPLSAVAMLVTFLATTQLPLHTAILIGAITSLVLYCAKASQAAELMALKRADDGGWLLIPVPDAVESNAVTVLEYTGVGLFAEVPRIDEEWPRVAESQNAVVVLGLRTLPDVPSSKVIKSMRRWAEDLQANDGRLIIAGVSPATAKVLRAGGLTEVLGPDGVVPENDRLFAAIEEAVARGQQWIARKRDTPSTG
jgi:SulP family sulfate permease